MNLLALVLFSLLLIPAAVFGGSTNNALRPVPNSSSGSNSFEENSNDPKARKNSSIPSSFDSRSQWSHCPSISRVLDYGCCHASHALVPTSVMTDRTCIVTNRTDVVYSAYDALACCESCAASSWNKCERGSSTQVWKYWTTTGIVTESCMPYVFDQSCRPEVCPDRCAGTYSKSVKNDKRKGLTYYGVPWSVHEIQDDIMSFGPVEAKIQMYFDFATFKGNEVYRHEEGPLLGDHHVKIIGWGTQQGTDYWLISNSFGEKWGDHGFGKFLRGVDHLGIESNVHAGLPFGY